MKRMLVKRALQGADLNQKVTVGGWVRTRRASKAGFSFVELNDGSCLRNLQLVVPADLTNYQSEVMRLHPGAAIIVEGLLQASEGAGQAVEVQVSNLRVLGFAEPMQYPLGKQRISFERLREVPHLRARTNSFGAVARLRSLLAHEIHQFFRERYFLYVHTPIITASDCEGAGEMFQVTTGTRAPCEPETPLRQAASDKGFFGQPTWLTVSGQLEGEAYACALGNIYTFGPTFRAENSNTRRHLAEFWMVEPEMAFADLATDMQLAEDFLRHLFQAILREGMEDLTFFDQRILPGVIARLERLAGAAFKRITYTEAIDILVQTKHDFEYKPAWGMDLQSEHERFLTEEVFQGPLIVTDYPAAIKAFYMRRNDDGKTVAAMDVLLPEVGEIIGGSQREERLEVLETTIRASGLEPENYGAYLDLRRYGSVPHAGFGLGFERLVQFCSGMHNIRDVIPYPRAPGLCL